MNAREHLQQSTSVVLSFTVPKAPVPKARPRVVNGHSYTPRKTREFEAAVAWYARGAMSEAGLEVLTTPVILDLVFCRLHASADIDNAQKSVLDGLNHVVYADDRQVIGIVCWRDDGALPAGVHIEVIAF